MDYKRHIEFLEAIQNNNDRLLYLQLINTIIAIGKETEFNELKISLREIFTEVKKTPNPFSFRDGSVTNKAAYLKLNETIIKIIDLLNDYYGNYKRL